LPRRRCRRRHEFADGLEDCSEAGVGLSRKRVELLQQLCIRLKHLTQVNECAHDFDLDLHGRGLRSTLDNIATPCSVNT